MGGETTIIERWSTTLAPPTVFALPSDGLLVDGRLGSETRKSFVTRNMNDQDRETSPRSRLSLALLSWVARGRSHAYDGLPSAPPPMSLLPCANSVRSRDGPLLLPKPTTPPVPGRSAGAPPRRRCGQGVEVAAGLALINYTALPTSVWFTRRESTNKPRGTRAPPPVRRRQGGDKTPTGGVHPPVGRTLRHRPARPPPRARDRRSARRAIDSPTQDDPETPFPGGTRSVPPLPSGPAAHPTIPGPRGAGRDRDRRSGPAPERRLDVRNPETNLCNHKYWSGSSPCTRPLSVPS